MGQLTEDGRGAARGGRPLKFHEKSKAVTLTLPLRILNLLQTIHPDRARAIVKVTESAVASNRTLTEEHAELVEVLPGMGMIVVGSCESLRRIPWIHLAEMAPGRNILVLKSGAPIERLEIELLELIGSSSPEARQDRPTLKKLQGILATLRREERISTGEVILFRSSGR